MARAFKSLCPRGKFRTAWPLRFLPNFTFLPLQSEPQPISSQLHGPIAQLDRVLDYESRGRGFESSSVRHFTLKNLYIYQIVTFSGVSLSPVLSPENNLKSPFAPARDTVLYCVLTCLARACATCVSLLNWGSTRAPVRDWGQFV